MRHLFVVALLALAACASQPTDDTVLSEADFSELPGWGYDQHGEAFRVFAESCAVNLRRGNAFTTKLGTAVGDAARWRATCQQALATPLPVDDATARAFFERSFTPYRVTTGREPFGRLTGYYLPLLKGSMTPTATFRVPVYGLPAGFAKGKAYPARAQIEAGALHNRAPILLYVDDPVMLFFVHIQGSGKVQLPDGQIVTIQYAGQNGHGYVAIGKPMKEQGLLEEVSLQTIRDYLYQNPDQAQGIMNLNPSFIFFSLNAEDASAKGALGISLTPARSLAIDDDRATYGVPTYLVTTHPNFYTREDEPLNRLMVSQDTGGALHGPHRGDIFFGIGPEAEWAAGHQNTQGEVYWLLPN